MAKPKKTPKRAPKHIVFVLTPAQRARLETVGMRNTGRKSVILRCKLKNGRLVVTHHRSAEGKFVSSNAAFA